MSLTEKVRRRCWTALSYDTAIAGGLHGIAELQQFIARQRQLTEAEITALAFYLGVKP